MENVSTCLLEKLALFFSLLCNEPVVFPSQFVGVSKAPLPTSLLCSRLCWTDILVSPLQRTLCCWWLAQCGHKLTKWVPGRKGEVPLEWRAKIKVEMELGAGDDDRLWGDLDCMEGDVWD